MNEGNIEKIRRKNERRKRTKIERLKYINIYKDIMTEELPIYLRGKKKRTEALDTDAKQKKKRILLKLLSILMYVFPRILIM